MPNWRRARCDADGADARHRVRREVAAGFLGVGAGDRFGDHGVEVDVGGWRLVTGELLVELGHPQLPDAVAHRVVDDRPDRSSSALDAADDDETPQRPGPVERLGVQLRREIEQLTHRPRRREHDLADVGVEVELGIGHPRRRREPCEPGNDTLIQPRCARDAGAQRLAEPVHVERAVEQYDRRAARVEPGILLDVPHERFVFAHPAASAFSCPVARASVPWCRRRRGRLRSGVGAGSTGRLGVGDRPV